MALVWAAWVGVHVRDPTRVLRCARELRALASERGYPHWVAFAEVKEGWAAAHGSSSDPELVRLMRRRRRDWLSVQGRLAYTWLLTTTADACLEAVDEALDLVRESGGESAEAEIYRLRGELELHDRAGAERAEASFRSAIDCARRQQARSWELRAVTSLARLWHGRGEAAPALELLRPCLESFAEGFETPDVVDATRLVRALEARGRVGEGG